MQPWYWTWLLLWPIPSARVNLAMGVERSVVAAL